MFHLFFAMAAAAPTPPDAPFLVAEHASVSFTAPVQLSAGGSVIRTEAPGYAAPAFHDVNGDGIADLVVGQFNGGKMKVYPGKADGTFGAGDWLKADGEVAKVPGVW